MERKFQVHIEQEEQGPDVRRVESVLRTPRIAVGVPDAMSIDQWCGLMARATATWGALDSTMYFPVNAWPSEPLWDAMISFFDPDFILSGGGVGHPTDEFQALYDPLRQEHDGRLTEALQGSFQGGPVMPLDMIFPDLARLSLAPMVNVQVGLITGKPDSLRLLVARHWGLLTPESLAAPPDVGGVLVSRTNEDIEITADVQGLRRALTFINSNDDPRCPASWNRTGLRITTDDLHEAYLETPIMVLGNSTADMCLWLTLMAIRGSDKTLWWPDDLAPTSEGDQPALVQEYVQFLGNSLPKDAFEVGTGAEEWLKEYRSQFDPVAVISCSLKQEELQRRMRQLETFVPKLRYEPVGSPLPYLRSRRVWAVTESLKVDTLEFTNGRSHGSILPSLPAWLQSSQGIPLRLLTETKVEGFTQPTSPAVLPLIRSKEDRDHRAGRYGIVAQTLPLERMSRWPDEYVNARIFVEYPNSYTLLGRIAHRLGGKISLSSAGQKDRELVSRFGSPEVALNALIAGPLRSLLDEFWLNDRDYDKNRHRGNMQFQAGGPRYLRHEAIRRALGEAEDDRSISMKLADWTERGIIHYGMALRCKYCSRSGFYSWDNVNNSGVTCPHCLNHFVITPEAACGWEPVAALNAIVAGALVDDALQEIALLAQLRAKAHAAQLSLGIEWMLPGLRCETDVAGTTDGDLLFGEAKSTNEVDMEQVNKYGDLASRANARRIIFATSQGAWSDATQARFSRLTACLPRIRVESWTQLLSDSGPQIDVK